MPAGLRTHRGAAHVGRLPPPRRRPAHGRRRSEPTARRDHRRGLGDGTVRHREGPPAARRPRPCGWDCCAGSAAAPPHPPPQHAVGELLDETARRRAERQQREEPERAEEKARRRRSPRRPASPGRPDEFARHRRHAALPQAHKNKPRLIARLARLNTCDRRPATRPPVPTTERRRQRDERGVAACSPTRAPATAMATANSCRNHPTNYRNLEHTADNISHGASSRHSRSDAPVHSGRRGKIAH